MCDENFTNPRFFWDTLYVRANIVTKGFRVSMIKGLRVNKIITNFIKGLKARAMEVLRVNMIKDLTFTANGVDGLRASAIKGMRVNAAKGL